MMFWMPLAKPINDGMRDPRIKVAPVYTDNTMPQRDWSKFDAPAKTRIKKRRAKVERELPALLRTQAA
jgi:hypothetical protein